MDLQLALLGVGWAIGWYLLWRVPALGSTRSSTPLPATAPAEAPSCAVVIPARNEESSLPALLASLRGQTVTPTEIVVVDDQSTDGTVLAARADPSVHLISGAPLPAGWTGKTWACQQGVQATSAPVVVFVDADVTLAPDALGAVLREQASTGGLVSVQPFHRVEKVYERFSALFNVISFMAVGAASPGAGARGRGAFGPLLCCARSELERVGGFAAVRGEIVEDIALARRFDTADLPVRIFGGTDLVSFRMYPDGIRSLVEGWSKNFAAGAASAALPRVVLVFAWVTALLASVQALIEAGLGWGAWMPALVAYWAFAAQLVVMLGQLGNFGRRTAIAYPALAGIFVAVFVRSIWLTVVRREVVWRGRTIPLRERARWDDPHPVVD